MEIKFRFNNPNKLVSRIITHIEAELNRRITEETKRTGDPIASARKVLADIGVTPVLIDAYLAQFHDGRSSE